MSNGITDLLEPREPDLDPVQIGVMPRLPLFMRQFGADLAGNFLRDKLGLERLGDAIGSREINRSSLSGSEYDALQESVVRALERGGSNASLTYADYGLDDLADYVSVVGNQAVPQGMQSDADASVAEWVQGLRDQGSSQEEIERIFSQGPFARVRSAQSLKDLKGGKGPLEALLSSPAAFSLAGTIGGASIEQDPETGEYWVYDEYDFNDAANLPEDASFLADAAKEGLNPYGQARNLARYYGSKPGEGSPVRINLGDLEHLLNPEEDKPGLLTRGLAALGNMLRREREPSPVQAAQRTVLIPEAPRSTPMPRELEIDRIQFDN